MIVRRLLPAIAIAVIACSEKSRSDAGGTFEVDSSGKYPVVTSRGAAVTWHAMPLFSVGAAEGDTMEFGSVRSILLDSAGTLIVVDARNQALRQFDSSGAFVRQIGRVGSGPGEFRDPYSVAWLHGNLALLDPGNPRIALFTPDGRWITSWLSQPLTGPEIRLHRTPPGFSAFGYRATADGAENFYVRYDSAGPQDTIPVAARPDDLERGIMCPINRGLRFFSNPFAARFLQIPSGGGRRVLARTDAYRIAFIDRRGDTTMVIAGSANASPLSDAEWQGGMADWEKFRKESPTTQCDRTSFNRPAVKPVLNWLFLDGAGMLWVEVQASEGIRYDVFDVNGHPYASVAGLPPSGGTDPSVAGNRAAFVVSDTATDVQSVRVFRIAPSSGR